MINRIIALEIHVASNLGKLLIVLDILLICILGSVIFLLLMKLRKQKNSIHEYTIRQAKYHNILDLTEDVIFEYDIKSDIMYHSDRYKMFFGRNPTIYNYTESFVELAYVHPDDRPVYREFCYALHIGKSNFSYEFRFLNNRNEYEWCHVNGSNFCEGKGLPKVVLGRIVNIDAQKKELNRLQFKAQRDQMTNIYNKNTVIEKINEVIKHGKRYERHALFVIDIDDFKHVNDTYGHLQGDYVLTSVVSMLINKFRDDDILGRIGGDEFVALMKNVSSREEIVHKAETICKVFNQTFRYNGEEIQVSCSIGIAIYPMDGVIYEELLEHADLALYDVKADGKNSYMLYCDLPEVKE